MLILTLCSDSPSIYHLDHHLVFNALVIVHGSNILFCKHARGIVSGVDYEVIRSQYINSSQPDMTRLSFIQTRPRIAATYQCTVTVEGRRNIASGSAGSYDFEILGSGTSSITVTGE